jgi:cardiolipin synthase
VRRLRALSLAVVAIAVTCSPANSVSAEAAPTTSMVSRVWVEPASGYGFVESAINDAHRSIDLSMYELSDPAIERDLINQACKGVHVKVILNAAYDGTTENAAAATALREGSVDVVWAPSRQIFHAKYLVVDGATAYLGTGNFVPADYPSTRDFWVADTQPADVSAIVDTFNADFAGDSTTSHQAGGLVWSPRSTSALTNLITSAHRTLLVENEEMDSAPIEESLVAAAKRGVVVEVVMSRDAEWTGALDGLVRAGVRVRLLGESQIYIHAKVICADCTNYSGRVFVGSENFSTSSLVYNRELGVVTSTLAAVRAVRHAVEADYALGRPLRLPASSTTTVPGAPSGHGVTITSLIASVTPGGDESLRAHSTTIRDSCSLSVVLPSGYASHASGLGHATANAGGDATWRWRIGPSTGPGTAHATVTCSAGTTSRTFSIT